MTRGSVRHFPDHTIFGEEELSIYLSELTWNTDVGSFTPLETNLLFNNGDLFQGKRKMSICFGAVDLRLKVYVESIIRCFSQS